jgi:Ser/Thr protein kinase RdoA (MazF antagonist)
MEAGHSGSPFALLSLENQIEHITELAREILLEYPFEVQALEVINFEFNATFAVSTSTNERYALRVNVNSERTYENLLGEIALVNFLVHNGAANLPKPISSKANKFALTIYSSLLEKNLGVVLYSWLEGEELGDDPSEDSLAKLGAAMAQMHQATQDFNLPVGADLPLLRDFLWGTKDVLFTSESPISSESNDLLSSARTAISEIIDELYSAEKTIAIHADLHGGNVFRFGDEISIFDFDDSGIGLRVQDLATALYYLDTPEQDEALLSGYKSVSELPGYSEYQLKGLLLQRRIILLNYLFETTNKEHRDMAPKYLEETLRRVRDFLDKK